MSVTDTQSDQQTNLSLNDEAPSESPHWDESYFVPEDVLQSVDENVVRG